MVKNKLSEASMLTYTKFDVNHLLLNGIMFLALLYGDITDVIM